VAWSPDGKKIASGSVDETIKIWDSQSGGSVDWQSPDCQSQILMVLSQLPLAICFPSGLHATEQTLKLREVITRINRTREEKIEKTFNFECPVSIDHRRHAKRKFLNFLYFYFLRICSSEKSELFEWLFTLDTQTGT